MSIVFTSPQATNEMFSLKFFFVAAIAMIVVAQAFAFPGGEHGQESELARDKKAVLLGYGYPAYYSGYYRGLYNPYYY
ncbi:Hypothetical protein NTJ_08220 [Nesidiocoris tenuis]|uniref:Uncharacterized protein n=1 Tax=Nesidiocoris tenuis TaxID=355587 RepID=A0ABN7AT69_9HEMI|nr:Hypothetical protein NTJ_08220 [Nesidiocoris tenuis]